MSRRRPRARRSRTALGLVLGSLLAAVAGCATAPRSPGDDLLARGDYAAAVTALTEAQAARPDDPALKRNLGIALLETGKTEAALAELQEAHALAPKDPVAAFHLGRAAEAAGQPDLAARAYGDYLALGGKHRAEVQARLNDLAHRRAEAQIKAALAQEASLSVDQVPDNTLAVPDFVNVAASDTLAPLSRGLSAVMVTDLSKVREFRVLERDRLQVLLDELDLARPAEGSGAPAKLHAMNTPLGLKERLGALIRPSTGKPYYTGPTDDQRDAALASAVKAFQADHKLTVDGVAGPRTLAALQSALGEPGRAVAAAVPPSPVDPATAPRLGVLLGARRFVQGGFAPLGQTDVRLDASLVGVREGTLNSTGEPVEGPLPRILHLEKDLLGQVLAALGVTPTPEERRELERVPTESFPAFLAWSRGLVLQDQGRREEALAAFREAARLDPGFEEAKASEEVAAVTPADQISVDRAEIQTAVPPPGVLGGAGAADRLLRTGAWVGLGPGPDLDRWADTDPTVTGTEKLDEGGSQTGTIEVGGTLPGRNQ